MSSVIDTIDALVMECQSRLEAARQELQKAEQRALKFRQQVQSIEAELKGLVSARDALSSAVVMEGQTKTAPRVRALSASWISILEFIASGEAQGRSLDEIDAFVGSQGMDIQRPAIRSQLSSYKQRGLLESVGEARYKVTPLGLEATKSTGD